MKFGKSVICSAVMLPVMLLCTYPAVAQTFLQPTTGLQNTYLGACEVNTCGGTYMDNGGAIGNYANGVNAIYRTFCPTTAGSCVRISFTSFNLEPAGFFGCYDYLEILNGPTQGSPVLWQGCGTSLPPSITANNSSGCLSVRFTSDATTNRAGWVANLSCVPCSGAGPSAGQNNDCSNAQFVCDNLHSITANSQGPGLAADACLSGCALSENYSNWYLLNVTQAGSLGLSINPTPNAIDYDFALYGRNKHCGSLGNPVRCSYAANTGNTGMMASATDVSEDVNGNGWVDTVAVDTGIYYLMVNQWSYSSNSHFQLDFTGTAVIGLPQPTVRANDTSLCVGDTLVLSTDSVSGAIYHWIGPAGTSWTTTFPSIMIAQPDSGFYDYFYEVNGCTSPSDFILINVHRLPVPQITDTDSSICRGDNVVLMAGGGIWYLWDNGSTNSTITVSPVTTTAYRVLVKDSFCQKYGYDTIIVNPLPVVAISPGYDSICRGSSASLIATGGPSYAWSTGATTASLTVTPLINSNYSVTVTDINICTAADTVSVIVNPLPTLNLSPALVTICEGNNTTLTSSGGSTYLWSTGQTSSSIVVSPNSNTVYSVTASTAANCTATATASVLVNPTPVFSIAPASVSLCDGQSVTLVAGGGGTYLWSNSSTTATINVSPITTTPYSVTVTSSNNCTASDARTVYVNSLPTATITPAISSVCIGSSTNLSAIGGITFAWSNSATTIGITVSPVSATSYSVTVTDLNGCTASTTRSVSVNPLPVISISPAASTICTSANTTLTVLGGGTSFLWSNAATSAAISVSPAITTSYSVTATDANSCSAAATRSVTVIPAMALSANPIDVNCNGGTDGVVNLSVSSGQSPYGFLWNNGSTSQNLSALTFGGYDVTVTDNAGCTASISATVSQPASISVSETHVNVSCSGGSTGSIDILSGGGITPLSFRWNDGLTSEDRNNITAGNYIITVTDSHQCTTSLPVTVSEPGALIINETHADVACGGAAPGSINIIDSGGTAPYTYLWNDGPTSQNRTNLSAGNYSVTVRDLNLCSASISVTINLGVALNVSETHTNVLCNGDANGTINITTAGGSLPQTFIWNDGNTFQNRTNISAGLYSVSASDPGGCSAAISINITEPQPFTVSAVRSDVACNGGTSGSIIISSSGGTSPFAYLWNDGTITQNRNFVSAGNYSLTVTDQNACTFSITTQIAQPNALGIAETHTDVTCNAGSNGSITLTTNGGTLPYTFLWNDGNNLQNRINLFAGNYLVTVSDSNSCSVTLSAAISEPLPFTLAEAHTDVLCFGTSTGAINTTSSGATSPYSYLWSDGSTTQNMTALPAGNYSLTVSDINFCTDSLNISLTQPLDIVLSENHINILCNGTPTGSVQISVVNGFSPFTYIWNDGDPSAARSNLIAGNFSVTVSDFNSCSSSLSMVITEPPVLVISETHIDAVCNGGLGSIDVTSSGGTPMISYAWNDGILTEDRNNLTAGNYAVTVNDNNNCSSSLNITIASTSAIVLSETHNDVSCFGASDANINVSASGGSTPYTYLWNDGNISLNRTNVTAGAYSLSVTDNNNCLQSLGININQPTALSIGEVHVNQSCAGYSDASINISVTGGSPAYSYMWSDGPIIQNRINIPTGVYLITVTDNNLCTASTSIVITEPLGMTVTPVVNDPSCPMNGYDGKIVLNVSGSTTPYLFSWSNGANVSSVTGLAPGVYNVTITDANGCAVIKNFQLAYQYDFSVVATPSVTINMGEEIQIGYTVTGNAGNFTGIWSPSYGLSCLNCQTPIASPIITTLYTITVVNDLGCKAVSNTTVTVVSQHDIFVPNAFSPNGDGNNDLFQLFGNLKGIEYADIKLFNRWGEKVFESNDHHFTWDGTYKGAAQSSQLFIWQLKVVWTDGLSEEVRKGSVMLLR